MAKWMTINKTLDGKSADDRKWFTLPVNTKESNKSGIISGGLRDGESAERGGTKFPWFFQFKD